MPSPNSFQPPSARSHHQPDHRKQDHHKPAEKSGSDNRRRNVSNVGGEHIATRASIVRS